MIVGAAIDAHFAVIYGAPPGPSEVKQEE